MKEDIKTAFEKAANTFDARANAAKQQRDQDLTERQQFEEGYRRKMDNVILPALKAVSNILEPHGWTCKISESKTGSTKFEVFRGNMKGASATRPHMNFSADAGSRGSFIACRDRQFCSFFTATFFVWDFLTACQG